MNKETINEIAKQFGIAIDWTQENVIPQILEVMNKYAEYRVTIDTVWCAIIGLLFIVVTVVCAIVILKNVGEYRDYDAIFGALIIGGLILSFLGFAFVNTLEALMGWKICPEMMMIEHLKDIA